MILGKGESPGIELFVSERIDWEKQSSAQKSSHMWKRSQTYRFRGQWFRERESTGLRAQSPSRWGRKRCLNTRVHSKSTKTWMTQGCYRALAPPQTLIRCSITWTRGCKTEGETKGRMEIHNRHYQQGDPFSCRLQDCVTHFVKTNSLINLLEL